MTWCGILGHIAYRSASSLYSAYFTFFINLQSERHGWANEKCKVSRIQRGSRSICYVTQDTTPCHTKLSVFQRLEGPLLYWKILLKNVSVNYSNSCYVIIMEHFPSSKDNKIHSSDSKRVYLASKALAISKNAYWAVVFKVVVHELAPVPRARVCEMILKNGEFKILHKHVIFK